MEPKPYKFDVICELVKRLGNSPYSDCRQETMNQSSSSPAVITWLSFSQVLLPKQVLSHFLQRLPLHSWARLALSDAYPVMHM